MDDLLTIEKVVALTGKSYSTILRFARKHKESTPGTILLTKKGQTRQYLISRTLIEKHFKHTGTTKEKTTPPPTTPGEEAFTPPKGYILIPEATHRKTLESIDRLEQLVGSNLQRMSVLEDQLLLLLPGEEKTTQKRPERGRVIKKATTPHPQEKKPKKRTTRRIKTITRKTTPPKKKQKRRNRLIEFLFKPIF